MLYMDTMKFDKLLEETFHDFDANDHQSSSAETPLRTDAFDLSDDEKISRIENDVANILETLGMDMSDDSLKGTPKRVAKMFVQEIFGGLHPKRSPKLSTFDNKYKYGHMLVEKNITLYSTCEHHLLPIVEKRMCLYFQWYCDRIIQNESYRRLLCQKTSSQERLTRQVVHMLQSALETKDVACVIDAKHLCVNSRGIRDVDCSTITA